MSDKTTKKRLSPFRKLGLCGLATLIVSLFGGAVLWASSPHIRAKTMETINPSREPDAYDIDRARETLPAPTASSKLSPNLISYEASEWEPSWSLTLSGGTLIQFRQLDPAMGADFIPDSYTVTSKTALADGWTVEGDGEKGALTFTTTDVSPKGGCTHSASGYTHRDSVTVQSPRRNWRGCGAPKL